MDQAQGDKAYIPTRYPNAHPSGSPRRRYTQAEAGMPRGSSGFVKVFYPRCNQAELVALLRERLPTLATALPLKRVSLFGSWAQGKVTAFSDIDLMVIYADPPREDAYQVVRRSLKLRGLEPHVYSKQQASAMQVTLECMTEGSIALFPDDAM